MGPDTTHEGNARQHHRAIRRHNAAAVARQHRSEGAATRTERTPTGAASSTKPEKANGRGGSRYGRRGADPFCDRQSNQHDTPTPRPRDTNAKEKSNAKDTQPRGETLWRGHTSYHSVTPPDESTSSGGVFLFVCCRTTPRIVGSSDARRAWASVRLGLPQRSTKCGVLSGFVSDGQGGFKLAWRHASPLSTHLSESWVGGTAGSNPQLFVSLRLGAFARQN